MLTQKTDFINKNDDIERSFPKSLNIGLNKPEYSLYTGDLQLKKKKFTTNRPDCNPLEPKYNLAKTEPLEPIIPKFIRDGINYDVSDYLRIEFILNLIFRTL